MGTALGRWLMGRPHRELAFSGGTGGRTHAAMHADGTGRNAFKENALCAIIEEACMPLSPEQEALCERLEKGESTPNAAALIRQQAHEIDDLGSAAQSRLRARSPSLQGK